MKFSLNEIEAQAKKASRGAGYDWGIAEEAGKAVRWLESHDLPGADVLVAHFEGGGDQPPRDLGEVWTSKSGLLCPLSSGAALNDCADLMAAGDRAIQMENVTHPLLVVPFAAWASIHLNVPLTVAWGDVSFTSDGFNLRQAGPMDQITTNTAAMLTCALAEPSEGSFNAPKLRGDISAETWSRLAGFAHRTYAPATEASRLLGAGAGVSDND